MKDSATVFRKFNDLCFSSSCKTKNSLEWKLCSTDKARWRKIAATIRLKMQIKPFQFGKAKKKELSVVPVELLMIVFLSKFLCFSETGNVPVGVLELANF